MTDRQASDHQTAEQQASGPAASERAAPEQQAPVPAPSEQAAPEQQPSGQAASGQVASGQLGSGRLGSGRLASEVEWRRLSPRMLIGHPILELIRAWPALVGLLVAGHSSGHGSVWSLGGLAIAIVFGILRWFTTTFRIGEDQVQLRRGLLNRRVLSVPRDRIRTVDATSNAMHRILGLTRLTIGTGRSERGSESLRLDGLTIAETANLRDELLHGRARQAAPAPAASASQAVGRPAAGPLETELAAVRPGWLRFGPFTMTGITAVLAAAGFGWRLVNEAGFDPQRFALVRGIAGRVTGVSPALAATEAVAVLAVAVALASTAGYVLMFWRFRLTRHSGGTLHVTRGLLTTRATTIEERRLRGVELTEPLLLRAVGGARCGAIVTGLKHGGPGAERGGAVLLPPAPRSEAIRVAGAVLGTGAPVRGGLTVHGPAARRRRFTRALAVAVAAVAVAVLLWRLDIVPAWVWQASLLLVPGAIALAADRYRALGHAITDRVLVTRLGSVRRRRAMIKCDGIIGWNVHRSFFQRRAGLATLVATTAAGRQGYRVQDVAHGPALRLADQATPGLLTPFLERRTPHEAARRA
jgi:putative membrane protein